MPKKKSTWVSRLKKGVKTVLAGPGHSLAGKKYIKSQKAKGKKWKGGKWVDTMAQEGLKKRLRRVSPELVKKKEIEKTALSRQTKKQLQGLSKGDYEEVMKILRKK